MSQRMNIRPARCAVSNVEPSCRIPTSNGKARRHSTGFAHPFRPLWLLFNFPPAASCPFTRSLSSSLRYLATVPRLVTDPKLPNLLNGLSRSLMLYACNSLCYRTSPSTSSDTILWHRQCIVIFPATHSYPQRQRMAQSTTVEGQVIDIVRRADACDLEEITRQCTNLTWNQVFLAVDRLSRNGKVVLVPKGLGLYTVTFPHRQEGRSDRLSLPS